MVSVGFDDLSGNNPSSTTTIAPKEVYAAGSVDATALGADAVTAAKIGDDVINSEHYVAGSIDNEHLADDAVDSDELAAGAVDLAHMSANSVDSDQYVDGSIDTAHIDDDAITLAKMAPGTDGNIISFDAAGNPVAVVTGDDGQVLTSAGAGQPPAFEAAGGGGAATKEFFSPCTLATGNATLAASANYGPGVLAAADNSRARVAFIVPDDFSSIDELVFVVNPDVTNGSSSWKVSVRYGAMGAAPGEHSGSSANTYNVTEDELYEVDISGVFSAIAAGDQCGIQIYQDGAGSDVTFFGVRFKY
jgi:hypothetical protein